MKKNDVNVYALFVLILAICVTENAFAYGSFGTNVNTACAPQQPYSGNCNLCHSGGYSAPTTAKSAYLSGGATLINYFCPAPSCTDNDGDTYSQEGGACGTVDCNDNSASIYPGATEICGDGIDQDCNGSDLACTPVCTDNDGDTFSQEGGVCGTVDCNDGSASIYPGATEICGDGIDQDCNGSDLACPPVCTDNDGDTFSQEGGVCGTVDCNDGSASIYPGATEICGDGIDQDCNGSDLTCPLVCTDNDGDNYAIEGGECGSVDCNDASELIYPGALEICGDGIDQDCNGSDKACTGAILLTPIFQLLCNPE